MNLGNDTLGTLLLCRHGETEWNRSGRIMGQWDSPMTAQGLARIRTLADMLARQGVNRIVASPLGRAALTGCMYSEKLSAPVYFDALLAELSAGAWQGELRTQGTVHGRPFRASWSDRPPGGESYADAEERVARFLAKLRCYHGETILIVGHAGINKVILKMLLNLAPEVAAKMTFPHDIFYRIDSSGQIVLFSPAYADGKIAHFET